MNSKIAIRTDDGTTVEAQSPVIISASRSTDIPAFYTNWFINRLKKGYVLWYNPFTQQPMYVSFKNTKVVVFWTKNPKPLIPYLQELNDRGIHYYFQFTLNDYEMECFEPKVPPLTERIETFKTLSEKIGKEKVIWRFDPLIVTPTLTPRNLLKKIWNIGNQLKGYTDKLVFSFVDINVYRKVQSNMIKAIPIFTKDNVVKAEFSQVQITELVEGLVKIRAKWKSEGWSINLATCAEKLDLEQYDIVKNRCIDGELMKNIFREDAELLYYLSYGKLPDKKLLFIDEVYSGKLINLKDRGQRTDCGCIISKDIGMYNTCPHNCIYCYANTSKDDVVKNLLRYHPENESIVKK